MTDPNLLVLEGYRKDYKSGIFWSGYGYFFKEGGCGAKVYVVTRGAIDIVTKTNEGK